MMRRPLSWTKRRLALLLAGAIATAGLWVIGDTFIEDDNFRVVDADLYRSGQLRSDEWPESYAEHPYRSVLNLRGAGPDRSWYQLERAFADQHGLVHYDVRMSANKQPSLEDMGRLVALMGSAPKPLLIHCKNGSDRSGLAAALYRFAVEGEPATVAERQLSLWFGHFPWLTSRTGAMDRALAAYVAAMARQADSGRLPPRPFAQTEVAPS